MKVATYKGGGFLNGIPARDLTDVDWHNLSPAKRSLVEKSPMYEFVEHELVEEGDQESPESKSKRGKK